MLKSILRLEMNSENLVFGHSIIYCHNSGETKE